MTYKWDREYLTEHAIRLLDKLTEYAGQSKPWTLQQQAHVKFLILRASDALCDIEPEIFDGDELDINSPTSSWTALNKKDD